MTMGRISLSPTRLDKGRASTFLALGFGIASLKIFVITRFEIFATTTTTTTTAATATATPSPPTTTTTTTIHILLFLLSIQIFCCLYFCYDC